MGVAVGGSWQMVQRKVKRLYQPIRVYLLSLYEVGHLVAVGNTSSSFLLFLHSKWVQFCCSYLVYYYICWNLKAQDLFYPIYLRASEPPKGGKKSPLLCEQFPSKSEGKDLKIVVQPETQHRARYLTEGSRGSVKDRTQQGFPTVKVVVIITLGKGSFSLLWSKYFTVEQIWFLDCWETTTTIMATGRMC